MERVVSLKWKFALWTYESNCCHLSFLPLHLLPLLCPAPSLISPLSSKLSSITHRPGSRLLLRRPHRLSRRCNKSTWCSTEGGIGEWKRDIGSWRDGERGVRKAKLVAVKQTRKKVQHSVIQQHHLASSKYIHPSTSPYIGTSFSLISHSCPSHLAPTINNWLNNWSLGGRGVGLGCFSSDDGWGKRRVVAWRTGGHVDLCASMDSVLV